MVEKLSKALEGLKNIQFTNSFEDPNISKKEKMFFCVLAADVMVSLKVKNLQNLPMVVENMINLCDDKDSDVRMVADESLNRIITSLSQSNILKIQVELHNIIKKNGPARCLRAALIRFGQLAHYIRPNKGRAHVQMLVPALIEITKREEESIHETLAASLENTFKVLGVFVPDNILKSLIKAFLHNLSSSNPVIRRCSASSVITVVQYCRKPATFNSFILNSLLDCVVPICEENSPDLILGVFGCLRLLLPTLIGAKNEEGISGSFGLRRRQEESIFSVDRLIQAYELCLHYSKSKDHNLVAGALETLNQILQNPPHQLESFFLSPSGFSRSYIHAGKENKLWSRSGSELSVGCSLPPMDETSFLDESDQFSAFFSADHFEDKPTKLKELEQTEDDKMVKSPFREKLSEKGATSQLTFELDSDTESIATSDSNPPTNFLMRIDTEEKKEEDLEVECSSDSQDDLYSPSENDKLQNVMKQIDVGSFTDTAVPLIYCARLLTASFLLDGNPKCLKSDRVVRVSVKSLALSCISAIIKLYPVIMKMNLSKNNNDSNSQKISDILLYCNHCDPQIKGHVSMLIGYFMVSALYESKGFESDWLSEANSNMSCQYLLGILSQGLKDKSSVCTRQALTAFKICVNSGLHSVYNSQFLMLLKDLPVMSCNTYWLIKVKLMEVVSELPYVCICDLTDSKIYEEEIINSVLFPLLGDEDGRVRQAAAEALVKIIPLLHYEKSTVLEYGKSFTNHLNKWLKMKKESTSNFSPCDPFSKIYIDPDAIGFSEKIEYSLSKIVSKLTCALLVPKNKYFVFGYIEALKLLSQKYYTTVYIKGWNCRKPQGENEKFLLTSSLVTHILSLLVTSPYLLDLAAFSNATLLLGNLFAGVSVSYLKTNYEISVNPASDEQMKWAVFKNEQVCQLAEATLTHLLKVLNLYNHLVEEVSISSVAESSPAVNAFLPLLSPIKKPEKKTDVKTEERKSKNTANYKQSAHYTKLQQLLKNAYTNYKVSLDKTVGDKFLDLLESTLYALSILLEVSTIQESGRCAEEMLSYFSAVVSLRPSQTIVCVNQLLKSVFGTNLASNWEESKLPTFIYHGLNLFDSFYHVPSELLSEKIRRRGNSDAFNCENLTAYNKRTDRKIIIKNSDKNCLATYIRLFEPMVVRSLQLYTISGDITLQGNVLRLLNQLVQLRVNYCLLDEKQVFLEFVLKQFELIEHGQVPGVECLLPHIFKFLILLSYEKQHSKPIMSVPKILQLCDGLMASDQPVETHCIPALIPVVEDVFLSRCLIEEKELETQREVLLSMLLRLVEFPTVMDMLTVVLNESKTIEEKERWKRWSRQVIDALVPFVSHDRLRIESLEGQSSFSRLMSSLSPNVLRPINPILKALVVEPINYDCPVSLNRWFSKVSVLLEAVLFVKEDALLNRLEETHPNINLTTFSPNETLGLTDPFNVKTFFQTYESSETAARFILKVVSLVGSKILESKSYQLEEKFTRFFVCVFYILKSGKFHRITNSLQKLISKELDSMNGIYSLFYKMLHQLPALTCQFSYFLTLLNYTEENYWIKVLAEPNTLSAKLVQSCCVIALSDYLCDNLCDSNIFHFLLKNNISELVLLSHEIPIRELFSTMSRRKSDWAFFLNAVSLKNFESSKDVFVEKLLRLLEITESAHGVSLLSLLVKKFLGSSRLALSLLASSIACRQVERLLMLPKEKVFEQMDIQDLMKLVNEFKVGKYYKRHSTLWSLLNKLGAQVFDLTDLNTSVIEMQIKNVALDEDWYFNQVKQKCCKKGLIGDEVPILLSRLSFNKIEEIMSTPDFNLKFLKNCFFYSEDLRRKRQMQDFDAKQDSAFFLFEASKSCLFHNLNKIWKELQKLRNDSGNENEFRVKFWDTASCLTVFMELTYTSNYILAKENLETVVCFGLWCLKFISQKKTFGESYSKSLLIGLECFGTILKSRPITDLLCEPFMREDLENCVRHVFSIVTNTIPKNQLTNDLLEKDLKIESAQMEFLLNFILTKPKTALLPDYLMDCLRSIIVSLCRLPVLSPWVLKVPESCEMQDLDSLKNFTAKFSVIGWSSRQQFEEIWVALLSVLGLNTQGDIPVEETGFVVQASVVAVEGITTLLKSTLLDCRTKKLIHHGRDFLSMKNIYEKLPVLCSGYKNDQFNDKSYHFLDNLEISLKDDSYSYGLLSVEYLWTAVKQITSKVALYEKHFAELNAVGLDLPSCIYLLTELYNQWIYQAFPDIKIVTCSLNSSIIISDLFTDISQFQWLLNFCFRLDELIIPEDVALLPLIILGCCKASAIVLPSEEVCEKIKKLMLRSNSVPCRIAAIQGLLYLLQSYVVCYAVNHAPLLPHGSTFQRDGNNFVAYVVNTFLPVALQFVQEFKLKFEGAVNEYNRCSWALVFYLLQHYQSFLGDLKEEFLDFILNTLYSKNCSSSIMSLLIRGTQRLLLTTVVDENFRDQLSKVSLEIISNNSLTIARNGLQLLTVLSFLDKRVKDIRQLVTGQDDPDKVMKDMEKINVLFDKLKRSYPKEAEVISEVISYILMDFSASDVLTKVIQEFLSFHQPHQKLLAGLLFEVFERAEQSLLEDWVVFSLPSFIQGLPIAMSIWTLNCFFVSASCEPWLRSLFPFVQSRIRMAEMEDRKLLCLSANHFYNQLKDEGQKKSFMQTFEKASTIDIVYTELLSSLR